MTRQHAASVLAAALVAGVLASIPTEVQSIGVCYGMNSDVLPSASEVVELYQSNGITGMRIYAPNADMLVALGGTGIALIMDVGNDQLAALASGPDAASSWFKANVLAYPSVNIRYITVGNEVEGSDPQSQNILLAMQNINAVLSMAGLSDTIKVSTAVHSGVITGFPPSKGTFSDHASHVPAIVKYLANTGAPLLANMYPYFSYIGTPEMDINYALFTRSSTVVQDGTNTYQNLFDSLVDTFYFALESAGAQNVRIVVSETGWPSAGAPDANVSNAQTYNQNLINHVGIGTPKMPQPVETYIFAMFNENQKPGLETEKHFGLFNGADKSPAYPIIFGNKSDRSHAWVHPTFKVLKMVILSVVIVTVFLKHQLD
ncbi:unnamed protein product [Alopecurus aequalis]